MKIASVFVCLTLTAAQGALDLTPVVGVRVLDGIKFQQLTFNDSGRTITYEHPMGWSYRTEAGRVVFVPPNLSQAEASIEQAQPEAAQTFDEETMKRLQELVLRSAPPGSQKAEVLTVEKNAVMINRQETFEVTISYQLSGTPFRRSVLFLNLPETQVRFRVTAKEQDFDKVHRAFRGSVYSWQWQ